jgi:hypothetical protein
VAGKTQQATLDRLLGGSTASDRAQGAATARANSLTAASTAQGNLQRERYTAGSEAADRAQRGLLDRTKGGMDAANLAGKSWMDRLAGAAGAYKDSGALALDRLRTGGGLAYNAGREDIDRITGGQAGAVSADTSKLAIQNSEFKNLMDLANGQADKYSSMTQAQRNEELQLKMSEIQGKLRDGSISAEQAKQLSDMYTELLKAPIAVAGTKSKTTTPTTSADPDAPLPMSR